jgi:hypothetical protein
MFELCHAGRVASMALRDGGMIMEAWAVTVHGKATRSRIENILIAETAKRDLEGCACGAGEYLAKSEAKPSKDIVDFGYLDLRHVQMSSVLEPSVLQTTLVAMKINKYMALMAPAQHTNINGHICPYRI